MNIQQAIQSVIDGNNLSRRHMRDIFSMMFAGEATDAQIAGLLVALRIKGETIDEITAAAQAMREFSLKVNINKSPTIDIVGTGGDGLKTLNVSTASAMVVAAAGGYVAKHGNRAASSKSGSADLLEQAGAKIDLNAEQVSQCVDNVGVGFMFAPMHHNAMKHVINARKQLATRTIFNVLGPLTNPANANRMLVGVYDQELCLPLANVLNELGCEHAMIVHGLDGMDEISICSRTHVVELNAGEITEYSITPEDFGMIRSELPELMVDGAEQSLEKINAVFDNQDGGCKNIIVLNSGAALYIAGLAESLGSGIELAKKTIETGLAKDKFAEYTAFTQNYA